MSKKNETELALLAAIVSPDEVKDRLEEAAAYGYEGNETQWVTCEARCRSTGEIVTAFVTLDPEEPDCDAGQTHDWQTPWEILGGLKENPGVIGHGGGIIAERVCMHCGDAEITNTWAQNPYDGTQGLTSVKYDVGRYRDEVEALKEAQRIYTYTIFDGTDGPCELPAHQDIKIEADSREEAIKLAQDALDLCVLECDASMGYEVGDKLYLNLWGPETEGAPIVAQLEHKFDADDLGIEEQEDEEDEEGEENEL